MKGNINNKKNKKMSTKKVTFDDEVQIMGISEPHIDHEREKEILTHFMKEQTIQNPNPNKLFSQESGSSDVVKEQPAFLQVNLFQKYLFLHQLTYNMTKNCSLNYKFST